MAGLVLDGKNLAKQIEQELALRIHKIKESSHGKPISLATILVGDDPASSIYVRMKAQACKRVGVKPLKVVLPAYTTTQELLDEIDKLNRNSYVQGILLQHPVPSHINERQCFDRICIEKDVDGVTCHGFGRTAMNESAYGSATPVGIMCLLKHYGISVSGKNAVIVGRSPILGKPLAMMLLNENATITICHSRTEKLPEIIHKADIVVGAVGKPEFVKGNWIKQGAVVIDAGYHPSKVGDIELSTISEKCSAYTPVPGGVGPMTIVSLISQTVEAIEKSL